MKRNERRKRQQRERRLDEEHVKNVISSQAATIARQSRLIKALEREVAEKQAAAAVPPPPRVAVDAQETVETESTAESADADDPDFTLDESKGVNAKGVADVMEKAGKTKGMTQRYTGLSKAAFEVAVGLFVPYIECTTNLGEHCDEPLNWQAWQLLPLQQFFITLVWFRLYQPIWLMASFFSLPARYVPKILKRVTGAMVYAITKQQVRAPLFPTDVAALRTSQARFQLYEGMQIIDLALDGMHLTVWGRSTRKKRGETKDERGARDKHVRRLRQPKHACFGTIALLSCTLDGRLVWYTLPAVGQEQALLKASELRELCREQGICIIADAGLKLNRKSDAEGDRCITIQSAGPKLIRLASLVVKNPDYFTPEQVEFFLQVLRTATIVSRLRIVVENLIAALRVYQILCQPFRGPVGDTECLWYQVHQTDVFQCCAALRDIMHEHSSPLRAADWVPTRGDIPAGFKPGYPGGPHANIDAVQRLAAKQFVDSGSLEAARKVAKALMKEKEKTGRKRKARKPLPEPDYGTDSSRHQDDENDDSENYGGLVHDERDDAHYFFLKDRPQPRSRRQNDRKVSKEASNAALAERRERLQASGSGGSSSEAGKASI